MHVIGKITKKIYRANIMILVLFIMFVSSLLGLLVSQYVNNMIKVSGLFQNYYKSYYYAYAGLELGLAQVKDHGYGFEQGVNDDYIYSDFQKCQLGSGLCQSSISITSRWPVLGDTYENRTGCSALYSSIDTNHNYYQIASGNAVIFPLFYDTSTGFNFDKNTSYDDITNAEFHAMNPSIDAKGTSGTEKYIIKVIDENLSDYSSSLSPAISDSPYSLASLSYTASGTNKGYLVLANKDGGNKEFCLDFGTPNAEMVSKYIVIDSVGKYGNITAALSAIKTDQLPSFLAYGTINTW